MSLDSVPTQPLRRLLHRRDVRLLLVAGLVSQTGDWVLGTGIAFSVYALTGSTVASAGALLAAQAPQVLCGSVAGVLVDRRDRRRVLVAVNLLLGVVLLPLVTVRDAEQVWVVFVVVAVSGCLVPFSTAAEACSSPSPGRRSGDGHVVRPVRPRRARRSAADFGTIMAAQAVGGIAGGARVSAVGHRFAPRALLGWGAVVFGVATSRSSSTRCSPARSGLPSCSSRWSAYRGRPCPRAC